MIETYPEIDHSVVQPGVLVNCGSPFLKTNTQKKHIHLTKTSSAYEILKIITIHLLLFTQECLPSVLWKHFRGFSQLTGKNYNKKRNTNHF